MKAKGYRPRTVVDKVHRIRKFLKWCITLGKMPYQLTQADLKQFLNSLKSNASRKNTLSALKDFLPLIKMQHLLEGLKYPASEFRMRRLYSIEELREFYNALEDLEAQTAFTLVVASGGRRSEILGLTWSQIDLAKRVAYPARRTRTKRAELLVFNKEATEHLMRLYIAKGEPDQSSKVFSEKRVKKHWRQAQLKTKLKITFQDLRFWHACTLAERGAPVNIINALQNRVPRTVLEMHYTSYSPGVLRKAYDQYMPQHILKEG